MNGPRADALAKAAAERGLGLLGICPVEPQDQVTGRSIALLGYDGPALWAAFRSAPEAADGADDPLDRWSTRIITALAAEFGATAVFPFGGPPYAPFLAWARRAEPVRGSRLGMMLHPERGLWSGWRGALVFAESIAAPAPDPAPDLCAPCPAPCLSACPVGAFTETGYDAESCRAHIRTDDGADCMRFGCKARRACPVGRAFAHAPDQAAFHMTAFRGAS